MYCISVGWSWRHWIQINEGSVAEIRSASSPISKCVSAAQRYVRSCPRSDHRRRTCPYYACPGVWLYALSLSVFLSVAVDPSASCPSDCLTNHPSEIGLAQFGLKRAGVCRNTKAQAVNQTLPVRQVRFWLFTDIAFRSSYLASTRHGHWLHQHDAVTVAPRHPLTADVVSGREESDHYDQLLAEPGQWPSVVSSFCSFRRMYDVHAGDK